MGGGAAGLPSSSIVQTGTSLSGGQTQTEASDLENTSPLNGEIVAGERRIG